MGNEPAIALYRRFGMAPVGVRPNYYPETGEDALVMWVRDIDSAEYAGGWSAIESLPTAASRRTVGRVPGCPALAPSSGHGLDRGRHVVSGR